MRRLETGTALARGDAIPSISAMPPHLGQADVVLIDGCFCTACFLAVMIRCTRPVTVLFDDYIEGTCYHWIEDLIPRDELVGRMARFTVRPTSLPPEQLTGFAGAFTDPR